MIYYTTGSHLGPFQMMSFIFGFAPPYFLQFYCMFAQNFTPLLVGAYGRENHDGGGHSDIPGTTNATSDSISISRNNEFKYHVSVLFHCFCLYHPIRSIAFQHHPEKYYTLLHQLTM